MSSSQLIGTQGINQTCHQAGLFPKILSHIFGIQDLEGGDIGKPHRSKAFQHRNMTASKICKGPPGPQIPGIGWKSKAAKHQATMQSAPCSLGCGQFPSSGFRYGQGKKEISENG